MLLCLSDCNIIYFQFFQEVTIPLMTGLKELKESEKHLLESLQKKDIEIQDYKSAGAQLSYSKFLPILYY